MLNLLSQLTLALPRSWHGNNHHRNAALTTILPTTTTIPAATTITTTTTASMPLLGALVNRLPYDILLLIFSQLELGDRIRCMRVCYTWRALLMEWPGMWDTLSTKDGCNIGYDLAPYVQYIRGKAVKRILYDEMDIRQRVRHEDETMLQKMMDLLVERNCSNISQVSIHGQLASDGVLSRLMDLTCHNLQHLDIKCTNKRSGISWIRILDTALRTCPQLESLVCSISSNHTAVAMETEDMAFQNIPPHQHLASLTLFAPVNRTSTIEPTSILDSIVPLLPKLRRLAATTGTSNIHTGWVLDAIMDHCPHIDSIRIHPEVSSTLDGSNNTLGGLRELAIGGCSAAIQDHVHQIIERHHDTLQILLLDDNDDDTDTTFALLSTLELPQLQTFHWSSTGRPQQILTNREAVDHLGSFLAQAPHIQELTLIDRRGIIHDITMIQPLSQLQTLYLQYCPHLSPSALARLFSSCPSLAYLTLHSTGACNVDTIAHILATPTTHLKKLRIMHCSQVQVDDALVRALQRKKSKEYLLDDLQMTCYTQSEDSIICQGRLLERLLDTLEANAIARHWKLNLNRSTDHYPLPDLPLVTDTYWRRRNGYYRQKLMDMDHDGVVDERSFTTTIPKPKRSMTLKERLLKRHKQ